MENVKKITDYDSFITNVVGGLSEYLTNNGLKTMVLGVSGGIDSTVTAAICNLVTKATNIPLIGLSLPCSSNKEDEISSALLTCKEFLNEYKEVNLQEAFSYMEGVLEVTSGLKSTNISQGNVKARLRMMALYDLASKRNGIVIGTSNLSEWFTGFWTLHGDVGDINPIGELWKTQVYELAKHLKSNVFKDSKALELAMNILPTDGNGTSNTDMEQIMPNHTYMDIDRILKAWVNLSPKIKPMYAADGFTDSIKNTVFDTEDENVRNRRIEACKKSGIEFVPTLGDLYDVDLVRRVLKRSWNTEYKRTSKELCVATNGKIISH